LWAITQPNADVTQMEHAQQFAHARDMSPLSGTHKFSKYSIASIPNDVVVSRASRLGVSIGKSPSQVSASVMLIKDLDLNRTLIMLKKKEESVLHELEGPQILVMNIANKLSEDLVNEDSITLEEHKGPRLRFLNQFMG
jgi:hypothetical protein